MNFFSMKKTDTPEFEAALSSAEHHLRSSQPSDSIRSSQIILKSPSSQLGSKIQMFKLREKTVDDNDGLDEEEVTEKSILQMQAQMSFNSNFVRNLAELKGVMDLNEGKFSLKLIYRASQNNFEVSKFHKICRDIPNTLVLAEVNNGNVVGGFSALSWNDNYDQQKTHFKSDRSEQSFIFNFTSKQKYELVKQSNNKAIIGCKYLGPTFGGGYDFSIGNQANKKFSSSCNFPTSYSKKFEVRNFKLTRRSLIGISDSQQLFLIKQWEVYQVTLQKPAQKQINLSDVKELITPKRTQSKVKTKILKQIAGIGGLLFSTE